MHLGGAVALVSAADHGNRVNHHLQFRRYNHVAAHRVGADAIGKRHRIMVVRTVDIRKREHQGVGEMRWSHHIRVRAGRHVRERPRDRGIVVHHTAELRLEGQLTLLGAHLIVRMRYGHRRLHCHTHIQSHLARSMALAVGGFHMIDQRDIAARVVDESGIVDRTLVGPCICSGETVRHNRGIPRIGRGPGDVHFGLHVKTVVGTRTQRRRCLNVGNAQSVVHRNSKSGMVIYTVIIAGSIHF